MWCLQISNSPMKQNKFGELIFAENDAVDLVMQGRDMTIFDNMIVDSSVDLSRMSDVLDPVPGFQQQRFHSCSVPEWHARQQANWHMPEEYKQLDIAAHVLALCVSEAELQR